MILNRVFSVIIQEEHQRLAGALPTTESVALLASYSSKKTTPDRFRKKEGQRPVCSHCNVKGHTVDRCYKIHGYPPGYRFNNQRTNSNQNTTQGQGKEVQAEGSKPNQSAFFASLNTEQYTQLMSLLQTHLADTKVPGNKSPEVCHVAGACFTTFSVSAIKISNCWVVDSGASSHICHDRTLFDELRSVHGISVVLPTQTRFLGDLVGDGRISDDIMLHNVLYLPQFNYNFLLISDLLKDDRYVVNFS
ncbi:MAG: hypothetical protein Q8761_02750 [Sweet potato little leaf phytoplasma]|nr:hypothetical protein [Sweet potato little leaf phytoplasma]